MTARRPARRALGVIASRRRGDAGDSGLVALQLVHVDKAAADRKGTDERMVFRASPRPRRPARCERSGQRIWGVDGTMGRMRSAAASIAARSGNLFVTALTDSGMPASDSRAASLAGARVTAYDGACRDQWAAGRYRFLSTQSIVFPQECLVKIRSVSPQVSKYFLAYRRTSDPRS